MCDSFVTPCTVTCQVPLSMGFFQKEYWGELPFPSPGDLANPRIEAESPALQVDFVSITTSNIWPGQLA